MTLEGKRLRWYFNVGGQTAEVQMAEDVKSDGNFNSLVLERCDIHTHNDILQLLFLHPLLPFSKLLLSQIFVFALLLYNIVSYQTWHRVWWAKQYRLYTELISYII